MMKLAFELVAATDLNTFNELVNQQLAKGYKFIGGMPMVVTEHEYLAPMLLEEEI